MTPGRFGVIVAFGGSLCGLDCWSCGGGIGGLALGVGWSAVEGAAMKPSGGLLNGLG